MSVIEPAAQAAILNGGLPALVTLGGGSLRVALFRAGVECSGNGYARQTPGAIGAAVEGDGSEPSTAAFAEVTFTPSGGSITYDQVRVYAADGTTLFSTSDRGADLVISEAATMTISYQLPPSPDIPVYTGAELQAALTADITTKRGVRLRGGRILVDQTINIVDGDGGRISGENASLTSSIQDIENTLVRLASVWQYDGDKDADQAAIEYDRASCLFERFALLGQDPADVALGTEATRTPVGFRCTRPGVGDPYEGIGSGKATFRDFLIGGFDVGFDFGEALADLNCDESQFDNIVAIAMRTMHRINNLQGMGYKYKNLTVVGLIDNVFEILAGGKLHVKNAFFGNPTTVLNFKKDLTDSFSHNNATYTLEGLDFDAQALGTTRVVRMDAGQYYASIVCRDSTFGTNVSEPSLTYPLFHIGDQTHLTIENAHNLFPGSIAWTCSKTGPHAGTSTITIKNSQAWTSLTDVEQLFRLSEATGSVKIVADGLKRYHTYDRLASIDDEVRTGAL